MATTIRSFLTILVVLSTVCMGGVGWAQAIDWTKPFTMARMNAVVVGGKLPAAAAGDSCTGGLLLSLHFENSDTVTEGTPAGCSAGDTTLAKTGVTFSNTQYQDGGYSLYNAGTGVEDAALSVSSGDIIASGEGKVVAYIYLTENFHSTYDSKIIDFRAGTSDYIILSGKNTGTGNDISLRHHREGEAEDVAVATSNLSTGQWYLVTANWKATGVTHKLSVTANSATGYDAEGGVSTFASNTGTLYINRSAGANNSVLYVDNLKIYSTSDL